MLKTKGMQNENTEYSRGEKLPPFWVLPGDAVLLLVRDTNVPGCGAVGTGAGRS